MPVIEKEVRTYHVGYVNDGWPADPRVSAWIQLLDEDKRRIGKLIFVDELNLPNNGVHSDNEFDVYYHLNRFNDIINMLRYEKPISIYFDTDHKRLEIVAAREPVGEEES